MMADFKEKILEVFLIPQKDKRTPMLKSIIEQIKKEQNSKEIFDEIKSTLQKDFDLPEFLELMSGR